MSPVESYPVSCCSGIDNGTHGLKDQLYVNWDADEGHSDGHWPKEHLGHCFTESSSNIQHIQVLSTVFTQFRVTECFNNLQTLVCVSSERSQCSFMASTPDFCLKLVCPYSVPFSTICLVLKSLWGHWYSASRWPNAVCSRKRSGMILASCILLVNQCPVTLVTSLVIGQLWWHY